MAHVLEAAGLPPYLETVMRPWVAAVETGTRGMSEMVASAASSTAASVKRRVVVVPALNTAIAEAVVASSALADVLNKRTAAVAEQRTAALAALATVVETLRTAEPSDDTRAIGLGW